MYATPEPPYEQRRKRALNAHRAAAQARLCFGLLTLLFLQYDSEGHMDEPVREVLLAQLHDLEQDQANVWQQYSVEDIPF